MNSKKQVYIAGKMRGVPYYNFPAFDKARDRLAGLGLTPLSPADMDREGGFDPFSLEKHVIEFYDGIGWKDVPASFDLAAAIARDNAAIDDPATVAVYVIHEGISESAGGMAEVERAMKAGKVILFDTMTDEQILRALGYGCGVGPNSGVFQNARAFAMWQAEMKNEAVEDILEIEKDRETRRRLRANSFLPAAGSTPPAATLGQDARTLATSDNGGVCPPLVAKHIAERAKAFGAGETPDYLAPVRTKPLTMEGLQMVKPGVSGLRNVVNSLGRQVSDGREQPVKTFFTDPATGGRKETKLARFDLLPPDILWELAEHYGKGSIKYGERNMEKGYPWSKTYAACHRHLNAFWRGEDVDAETGSLHLIAAAWHCFTMAWFFRHGAGTDDRPSAKKESK